MAPHGDGTAQRPPKAADADRQPGRGRAQLRQGTAVAGARPAAPAEPARGRAAWRRLLVEPGRLRRVGERADAPWPAVATVCVGGFLGQLDASIVSVALPTIRDSFHAGLAAVEWVSLAYLVTLVGTVAVVGRIADSLGRKLLYLGGFLVFGLASALCAAAPQLWVLDASRVAQGVGAAMLQANSIAVVTLVVPREKLGRAIGIQGAAQALGLAAGPTLGGVLVALGGWRLIFLVNVPTAALGLLMGWTLMPRSRDLSAPRSLDLPGAALLAATVGALLAGLSLGAQVGWTSPAIITLLSGAAVLGAALAVVERARPDPLLDPAVLGRPQVAGGLATGLLAYVVLFGTLFIVPFHLEDVQHLGPGRAGLEIGVLPVALGLVAPLAGRVADGPGARPLGSLGLLLAAAALALAASWDGGTPARLAELAAVGAGLGAFIPANNAAIMAAAPRRRAGLASGVMNMARGLGTALGVAVAALAFAAVAGATVADPDALHGDAAARGFRGAAGVLAAIALAAAAAVALQRRRDGTDPGEA